MRTGKDAAAVPSGFVLEAVIEEIEDKEAAASRYRIPGLEMNARPGRIPLKVAPRVKGLLRVAVRIRQPSTACPGRDTGHNAIMVILLYNCLGASDSQIRISLVTATGQTIWVVSDRVTRQRRMERKEQATKPTSLAPAPKLSPSTWVPSTVTALSSRLEFPVRFFASPIFVCSTCAFLPLFCLRVDECRLPVASVLLRKAGLS